MTSALIDQLLPAPHYSEQHHLDLCCDPQTAYQAARTLDFSGSRITRQLFHLRGLHFEDLTIDAMTTNGAFRVVAERPPQEFVIAHLSDRMNPVLVSTPDDFRTAEISNGVKIAWNFRTKALDDRLTRLYTETRVTCHGRTAALMFRPYWIIVKPFSGLIRKELLKAAATTNEIAIKPVNRSRRRCRSRT